MLNAWQSVKITDPDHPDTGRAGVVIGGSDDSMSIELDASEKSPAKVTTAKASQVQAL